MKKDRRIITILLTRCYDTISNLLYYISEKGYTHVAIALDEENKYYYSFNIKGFRKENPKISKGSLILKLEISQKSFEKIKKQN